MFSDIRDNFKNNNKEPGVITEILTLKKNLYKIGADLKINQDELVIHSTRESFIDTINLNELDKIKNIRITECDGDRYILMNCEDFIDLLDLIVQFLKPEKIILNMPDVFKYPELLTIIKNQESLEVLEVGCNVDQSVANVNDLIQRFLYECTFNWPILNQKELDAISELKKMTNFSLQLSYNRRNLPLEDHTKARIKYLRVDGQLSDQELQIIGKLKNLERLSLCGSNISGKLNFLNGLQFHELAIENEFKFHKGDSLALSEFHFLQKLELKNVRNINFLKDLKLESLRHLIIKGEDLISNDALQEFALVNENIEILELPRPNNHLNRSHHYSKPVFKERLKAFSNFKNLKTLNINDYFMPCGYLKYMKNLDLEKFLARKNHFNLSDYKVISNMKNLRHLEISLSIDKRKIQLLKSLQLETLNVDCRILYYYEEDFKLLAEVKTITKLTLHLLIVPRKAFISYLRDMNLKHLVIIRYSSESLSNDGQRI